MDEFQFGDKKRRELPKLSTLFIAIILGALVGVGMYQGAARGVLPLKFGDKLPSFSNSSSGFSQDRTQTIINEENAVIDVVDKASPSVVAIGVNQRVFNPYDPFSLPTNRNSTIGTGFVVSDKGVIVTNKHVVSDINAKYSVISKDNKKYEVRKIYRDPVLDLAIVQIDGNDLQPVELGDSSKLKVGQVVIAIGNALGQFTNSVTSGIVSGLGRKVTAGDPSSGEAESLDNLIQTDAAINPGNSGGPLFNSAGQVIGVNVATTEGAQNIGFAIPINSVKRLVDEFVQNGTVVRPFLGVRYRFVSREVAILNEVPQGAYVQDVIPDSSADKAGVKPGDILTKIDGRSIDSENVISEVISNKRINDSVSLNVWSDGKERQVNATLQALPNQ
jgi:serine protease Do